MNKILLILAAALAFFAYKHGIVRPIEQSMQVTQQIAHENDYVQLRRNRLASIVGCSVDASRQNCRCYDNQGSVDMVLNRDQCLQVVDRGLAALNDF